MKKTYINPTAKIVKIKPTRLMQASDQKVIISTTKYDGTKTIESRQDRYSIWDDGGEE